MPMYVCIILCIRGHTRWRYVKDTVWVNINNTSTYREKIPDKSIRRWLGGQEEEEKKDNDPGRTYAYIIYTHTYIHICASNSGSRGSTRRRHVRYVKPRVYNACICCGPYAPYSGYGPIVFPRLSSVSEYIDHQISTKVSSRPTRRQ